MLQLSNEILIIYLVFVFSFLIRLYFHLRYFLSFTKKSQTKIFNEEGASVIIATKNEAGNLKNFIPQIMKQQYPKFEVIVVNDHSTDETREVLERLSSIFENLRCYSLQESVMGKKAALLKGIEMAKFNVFLFTDADCKPATNFWIQRMMNTKTIEKELILGYGRYKKGNSWLNKLIRYDTLITGIKYLSFAIQGKAYMAVGRNFMYTRSLFQKSTSFQKHQHIPYGDDDLFANEMANASNTAICMDSDAHTISEPKEDLSQFFLQKIRHLKAGNFYKKNDKLILTLEWASKLFLVLSGISLLFVGRWEVLAFIIIILFVQHITIYRAVQKLKDGDLFKYAAILEVMHLFFISFIGVYSLINKKVSWK